MNASKLYYGNGNIKPLLPIAHAAYRNKTYETQWYFSKKVYQMYMLMYNMFIHNIGMFEHSA